MKIFREWLGDLDAKWAFIAAIAIVVSIETHERIELAGKVRQIEGEVNDIAKIIIGDRVRVADERDLK